MRINIKQEKKCNNPTFEFQITLACKFKTLKKDIVLFVRLAKNKCTLEDNNRCMQKSLHIFSMFNSIL